MADINEAMDMLKGMMSDGDGKEDLENIMSSVAESGALENIDSMMKIKNVIDRVQNSNDKRTNLLLALKPFLNSTRLNRMDETINLLKLAKLPNICLPSLEHKIDFVSDHASNVKGFIADIGIYDDPDNQYQGVFSIDVGNNNLMINIIRYIFK